MKFLKTFAIVATAICMATLVGCENEEEYYYMTILPLDTPNPYFDDDATTGTSLTLRWEAVPAAWSYTVRYWIEGDEANVTSRETTSNYYTISNIDYGTTLYAQVKANIYPGYEEGDSEYSVIVYSTTLQVDKGPINVRLIHASSSTLTIEWDVYGDKDEAVKHPVNVALYTDEECTDLFVSWYLSSNYYKPSMDPVCLEYWVRFCFTDLDPGTDYWVVVTASDDADIYSDPFKATTTTFDYTVSGNNPAQVGDILVAEDFHTLIHGGDVAYNAMCIGPANYQEYARPRGANPTSAATVITFNTHYAFFTSDFGDDYRAGINLNSWCRGDGTQLTTRAGYAHLGSGGSAIGYLGSPVLSAIPDGQAATIEVQFDVLSYNEGTERGDYGGYVEVVAIDNVTTGNTHNCTDWKSNGANLDDSNIVDRYVIDIQECIGGDNADHEFYTVTATLTGVTNTCRVRFASDDTETPYGLTRCEIDNVVITLKSLD